MPGLQAPSTGPNPLEWDQGLHRSFPCAGRVCWVNLVPLRGEYGELRFSIGWQPEPPTRMLSTDFQDYEAGRRLAEDLIRAHLQAREWGR